MNTENLDPNPRITAAAAAKRLGVSRGFLSKLRRDPNGNGPVFFQIGRKIEYGTADLDAWLAARRRTVTARHAGSSATHPAKASSLQHASA